MVVFFEKIVRFLQALVRGFGVALIKQVTMDDLRNKSEDLARLRSALAFCDSIAKDYRLSMLNFVVDAYGQIHQDLFVAALFEYKREGFFVEFGATNGIEHSNTHLLEKRLSWQGILAEPSRQWADQLAQNRSCHVSNDCVWTESSQHLTFNEVKRTGFSSINSFSGSDRHASVRANGSKYQVKTVSLNDLLERYDAPLAIDYLSVDTEGSEYDILSTFDFDRWKVSIISVEHNFSAAREKLLKLLESKGFVRVCKKLSKFDDWYVNNDLLPRVRILFEDDGAV